jgi:beta-lactamase superfamily II metal-dependent hydrolase
VKTDIFFLAVGNADCIVIQTAQNEAIVVDMGQPRVLLKFLESRSITVIHSLFLTHDHSDHAPRVEVLHEFIASFLSQKPLLKVYVPRNFAERLLDGGRTSTDPNRQRRIRAALDLIDSEVQAERVAWIEAGRGQPPVVSGDVSIVTLHPDPLFWTLKEPQLNEASMILRVDVGDFRALLLADLAGRGIERLLGLPLEALRANILKIPHHGAWPANDGPLRDLLDHIGAEVAVLSVGSTNPYDHVKPALFETLLKLKTRTGLRFLCTEVTRTCAKSAAERTSAGRRKPLARSRKCAGNIRVEIDTASTYRVTTETEHPSVVKTVPFAACDGRADVAVVPAGNLTARRRASR